MPGRLLFDVSALVQWYSYFSNPIGVPRVTQKILRSQPIISNSHVEFIARGPGARTFYRVPREIIRDLSDPDRHRHAVASLRGLFARSMTLSTVRGLLGEANLFHLPYVIMGLARLGGFWEAWCARSYRHQPAPLVPLAPPAEDDVIINLGDFWSQRHLADALIALKRSSGATLIHMMHDLFPINWPGSIHPLFSKIWREQIENLAPYVDHWLTNSEFVREDLRRFLSIRHLEGRPITVIPMGSDSFDFEAARNPRYDREVLASRGLLDRPYVLHVGTVEARKNIIPLIDAMTALRRGNLSEVPLLVLVGGAGWQSKLVTDRLKATTNEDGTVIWLRNVTDRELPALYRGASFSVVPGSLEGWGLPVRESLVHGLPCIVSDAGALSEAGGDLASYFDPENPTGLQSALEEWIGNKTALSAARGQLEKRLKEGLAFPTWNEAGAQVLQAAATATFAKLGEHSAFGDP